MRAFRYPTKLPTYCVIKEWSLSDIDQTATNITDKRPCTKLLFASYKRKTYNIYNYSSYIRPINHMRPFRLATENDKHRRPTIDAFYVFRCLDVFFKITLDHHKKNGNSFQRRHVRNSIPELNRLLQMAHAPSQSISRIQFISDTKCKMSEFFFFIYFFL